jgi:inorganic pyrophosphatase
MAFPSPFYRWRPHPWHGLEVGPDPPRLVHAYIELTPFDRVKYELDKKTGYLRVDRPNRTSSFCPTLYGFVPGTYCGKRVQELMPEAHAGDGDPLDICVISERPISMAEIILKVRVVGGLPMIDNGEADDKIVAVLENDLFWGDCPELSDLPASLVERLIHYFSTYKLVPGKPSNTPAITSYDRAHALRVIEASIQDYREQFEG